MLKIRSEIKARHCSDFLFFIIHQVEAKKGQHVNCWNISELEIKAWPRLSSEIKLITCHKVARWLEKKVHHLMGNRERQTSSHYSCIIFVSRKCKSWCCTRRKISEKNLLKSIESDITPSINESMRNKKGTSPRNCQIKKLHFISNSMNKNSCTQPYFNVCWTYGSNMKTPDSINWPVLYLFSKNGRFFSFGKVEIFSLVKIFGTILF